MNFEAQAETIVNAAIEQIKVPEIHNAYHKALWMQGRDAAIKHARFTVRHAIHKPFDHLKPSTQGHVKEGSKFWLEGHEAALKFIEMKLNAFVFNMTGGQILATRFNK